MARVKKGTLIAIGGAEHKLRSNIILEEVARYIGSGKLVITTVASEEPRHYTEEYTRIFRGLGVKHIYSLIIESREEGRREAKLKILNDATGVFFTGGDQLRITSRIGDTPIDHRIKQIYEEEGGVIIGTSAGASVLCETMMVEGGSDESYKIGTSLRMAPGLGLIGGMIIDQHFSQRGRMGRMLGAVAQNPANVGVGIDEDTAILVENRNVFFVLGSGAVYVFDGSGVTDTNIATEKEGHTMSMCDVKLHVLSQGYSFNLTDRNPKLLSKRQAKAKLPMEEPEKAKIQGQRHTS
ncbi:MAG: cyanophycinase [Chloracidobacterium sp.]|nr:cyanophycinase [Chloracidobacterium sp.]